MTEEYYTDILPIDLQEGVNTYGGVSENSINFSTHIKTVRIVDEICEDSEQAVLSDKFRQAFRCLMHIYFSKNSDEVDLSTEEQKSFRDSFIPTLQRGVLPEEKYIRFYYSLLGNVKFLSLIPEFEKKFSLNGEVIVKSIFSQKKDFQRGKLREFETNFWDNVLGRENLIQEVNSLIYKAKNTAEVKECKNNLNNGRNFEVSGSYYTVIGEKTGDTVLVKRLSGEGPLYTFGTVSDEGDFKIKLQESIDQLHEEEPSLSIFEKEVFEIGVPVDCEYSLNGHQFSRGNLHVTNDAFYQIDKNGKIHQSDFDDKAQPETFTFHGENTMVINYPKASGRLSDIYKKDEELGIFENDDAINAQFIHDGILYVDNQTQGSMSGIPGVVECQKIIDLRKKSYSNRAFIQIGKTDNQGFGAGLLIDYLTGETLISQDMCKIDFPKVGDPIVVMRVNGMDTSIAISSMDEQKYPDLFAWSKRLIGKYPLYKDVNEFVQQCKILDKVCDDSGKTCREYMYQGGGDDSKFWEKHIGKAKFGSNEEASKKFIKEHLAYELVQDAVVRYEKQCIVKESQENTANNLGKLVEVYETITCISHGGFIYEVIRETGAESVMKYMEVDGYNVVRNLKTGQQLLVKGLFEAKNFYELDFYALQQGLPPVGMQGATLGGPDCINSLIRKKTLAEQSEAYVLRPHPRGPSDYPWDKAERLAHS